MLNVFHDYADHFFTVMLCIGIFLIVFDDLKIFISRAYLRYLLRLKKVNIRRAGGLRLHIEEMLNMLPGKHMNTSAFFILTFVCAAAAFVGTAVTAGMPVCFAACAAAGAMPYAVLRLRCEKLRVEVNDEREKLLSLILSAYRMNNFNIEKAVEYAASQSEDIPHTSALLSSMLLRLRECSNGDDVRRVTDGFAESVNRPWGRALAASIRVAYVQGRDIHVTLEEQLKQIRETKQLMQERLRSNSESIRMTNFMIPATMALTVMLAVNQMGMTLKGFVMAQFGDSTAVTLFMMIIVLFVFNIGASQLLKNNKIDL